MFFQFFFKILLFYCCKVLIRITECLFTSKCEWCHMMSHFKKRIFLKKNSIFFSCCNMPIHIMTYDNFVFKFAFIQIFFLINFFFNIFLGLHIVTCTSRSDLMVFIAKKFNNNGYALEHALVGPNTIGQNGILLNHS